MNRLICVILMFVTMFSCVYSEGVRVAAPITIGGTNQHEQNVFQSFHDWSEGQATTNDYFRDPDSSPHQWLTYYAPESVMKEYIAFLQNNGFTLTEEYAQGRLASWNLDYDDATFDKSIAPIYAGNKCHLLIYSDSHGEYLFKYTTKLQMKDLGFRMSGDNAPSSPHGKSAAAGLLRYGTDTFETDDGRLRTTIGEAMILRDGVPFTGVSERVLNKSEWLWVGDYYRNEEIYFCHDAGYMMQGDIFEIDEFLGASFSYTNKTKNRLLVDGHGNNPFFLTSCNRGLHGPTIQNDNMFDELILRVMYYKKNDAAVYYVYAKMKDGTEPEEIEALCAVSLSK